jgi:S1-C subfamily serine protease
MSKLLRSLLVASLAALSACVGLRGRPPVGARDAAVEVLVDGRLELSAWFADAEGLVVTAAHGITGHTNGFEVVWPGHGRFPADRVALDSAHDLALLRARNLPGPVPFLRVADATPAAGARLWFVGAAEFRHGLMIEGNVARAEPTFNYYANHKWITRCYLAAAPSPPGTSGGPWLDERGRVAGNQSGYINTGTSPAGIALLAPPEAIGRLVAERRADPSPSLGCGVEELWTQSTGFIKRLPAGLQGLVTIPVVSNGPVARAGLNKENVISKADGHPLRVTSDLLPVLDAHRPGEQVELEVWTPEQPTSRLVRITLDATSF